MLKFVSSFGHCFKTNSSNAIQLASRYISGLLSQTARKNMERMDERLGEAPDLCDDTYQATQHFISASTWDAQAVYLGICQRANNRLGGHKDSVLVLDESAQGKKGDKSVGVGRQHNGRAGKQDNCQMGVYSALVCGERVCLIGARLFLPQDWISDPDRCRKAGVPQERIDQGHLTKLDQARELITEAIENGVKFSCLAMDAFYGRDAQLRRFIEEKSQIYCVDVPSNTRVFEAKPEQSKRPDKIKPATISVLELAKKLLLDKKQPSQEVALRDGDNGVLYAKVKAVRVWEWAAEDESPTEMWLLARQMPDGELKISFSNAPRSTSLKQLSRWQAARFWVERCFQDAKSHCGMGQYQTRGWLGWHHHMALVALAVYFQMEERLMHPTGILNLTAADITEMIEWVVVAKPTAEELVRRIQARHEKRKKSKASALARQREKRKGTRKKANLAGAKKLTK